MRPGWNIATERAWRCFGSCSGVAAEEISGLKPEIAKLLEPFAEAERKDGEQARQENRRLEAVGRVGAELAQDLL